MLFDLNNGQLQLNADLIAIPAFKKIWERDKSRTKETAIKELSYIYYYEDFNSPYAGYSLARKEEALRKEFIRNPDWQPDTLITEAQKTYREMQEENNPSLRLLRAAKKAGEELEEFFNTVDLTERDPKGRPVVPAKELAATMAQVGKIVESLDKLEEKVRREVKTTTKIIGGKTIGTYER